MIVFGDCRADLEYHLEYQECIKRQRVKASSNADGETTADYLCQSERAVTWNNLAKRVGEIDCQPDELEIGVTSLVQTGRVRN